MSTKQSLSAYFSLRLMSGPYYRHSPTSPSFSCYYTQYHRPLRRARQTGEMPIDQVESWYVYLTQTAARTFLSLFSHCLLFLVLLYAMLLASWEKTTRCVCYYGPAEVLAYASHSYRPPHLLSTTLLTSDRLHATVFNITT